jgi:hypothetical protein
MSAHLQALAEASGRQMLRTVRSVARRLEQDSAFAERFGTDPRAALAEQTGDVALPPWSGFQTLGDLIESLPPEARAATLSSIEDATRFLTVTAQNAPEPQPTNPNTAPTDPNAVAAAANAVAVANAVSAVNAAAVANAVAGGNRSVGMPRLTLFPGYALTALAAALNELQLSTSRQAALVRRAVIDGMSLPGDAPTSDTPAEPSPGIGDRSTPERRIRRYEFRGHAFDVTADVTADEIVVLEAELV